ncbi:MAG: nucleotidyltransferase [Candidatus Hydrogenedentota bacterium]|nr:MAG: nucleotidyltransferase [Candidatus Hydrogenedentota bacterium]
MSIEIDINKEALSNFCKHNYIQKLAFFGSVLRDDFSSESDIDVLVEFQEDHVPGFIQLSRLERELSELLGHRADIRTAADLSRYFRDEVVREAAVQYVA